jgi:hypothetical protein
LRIGESDDDFAHDPALVGGKFQENFDPWRSISRPSSKWPD